MREESGSRPRPRRETSEIVRWRARRLADAGFARAEALRLAGDREVDIHALLDLIDRGCSPELAARIAAPL
jgi:hypothetical protein